MTGHNRDICVRLHDKQAQWQETGDTSIHDSRPHGSTSIVTYQNLLFGLRSGCNDIVGLWQISSPVMGPLVSFLTTEQCDNCTLRL